MHRRHFRRRLKIYLVRFNVGLLVFFAGFLVICALLRTVFLIDQWTRLRAAGPGPVAAAWFGGFRFDLAALAMLLGLPVMLAHLSAAAGRFVPRAAAQVCLVAALLLVMILSLADLQYFRESGKHLTYEAVTYLDSSGLMIIGGAFELNPWLCSLSLLACIAVAVLAWFLFGRLLRWGLPRRARSRPLVLINIPLWMMALVVAGRGGLQSHPLKIGDSSLSPNPYVNALCLNPVYSVLKTATTPAGRQLHYYKDKENILKVREMLGLPAGPPPDERYPLLRESPGTPLGNRRNVVLFVLESWSGKDVGCLGGSPRATPFFDQLAGQGLLFTSFCANGIRTAEGLFTMLCSFPNQPVKPVMNRNLIHQRTRWRSLPAILAEAGYNNLVIHGRDFNFDHMDEFLPSVGFNQVLDCHDFPPDVKPANCSWRGYHDEDVVRLADQQFAGLGDRPFFGLIYTMNTHPPFIIPENFPKAFPSSDDSGKFLNAMSYTDHALDVFFSLAHQRPYFKNTIFILTADHARTRDQFNLASQHAIPLLIYAPGVIKPGISSVVGSHADLLPTVLDLLALKTRHAAWGRDLLGVQPGEGFAVSVSGDDLRWRDQHRLLNDGLTWRPPLLFDTDADPDCTRDTWGARGSDGTGLQRRLRAYISLSQTLLYENRVYR